MIKIIKKHTISFKNAGRGLFWALKSQPNYRIHIFLSLLSLIFGWLFKINYFEWLLIIVLIILGLAIETVNTAIELATDAIDQKWRDDIGLAKDVSAGAMLIYAFGSVILALIIFFPKFYNYLINFF